VVVLPGPPSVANKQKLCMNFFIIALIECMAEGLTFAEKIGASPEVLAAFYDTALAHPGLKQYAHKLAVRDTDGEGGFALSAGYKDVSLMLAEAKLADCPLELAEVIASKMQAALAQGRANQDWAAIQEIGRQRAGLAASAKTSS
jgi:3-hydroxyisobutyrate dehydrogenase-like beta-hydroxyacid dehydrogenase